MPRTGAMSVHLQPCKEYIILDPGGMGDYPSGCNSALFIWISDSTRISIEGDYKVSAVRGANVEDRPTFYAQTYFYDGKILQTVNNESSMTGTYPDESNSGSYSSVDANSVSGYNITQTLYSGYGAILFKSADAIPGSEGFVWRVKVGTDDASADNVMVRNITSGSANISWRDLSRNGSDWTVRYGTDEDYSHSVQSSATSITLQGLQPSTRYYYSVCNNGDDATGDEIGCISPSGSFVTPPATIASGCIDFMDLHGDNVQLYVGNYADAKVEEGVIGDVADEITSRHTIIESRGIDARTVNGSQSLATIPDGETSSIRLGNWEIGAQSECVTYQYIVDTNQADLLLLSYAVVLQEPNHDFQYQPMFILTITDENGLEIDRNCYSARFVPGLNTTGWNVGSSSNIRWKDWSTIGVDLAPLQGRKIFINLTTRDCMEAAHYGYAYYVLKCGKKEVRLASCGEEVENTFSLPDGFAYRWYKVGEESNTISTSRELRVSTNGTYGCDLSFLGPDGEARCNFTMRAIMGSHYPYARFDMQKTGNVGCDTRVLFRNKSMVTLDEEHQRLALNEGGLQYEWIIDGVHQDGSIQYYDLSEGLHSISLVASLSEQGCKDTMTQSIYIDGTCPVDESVTLDFCDEIDTIVYGSRLTGPGIFNLDSANHTRRVTAIRHKSALTHIVDTVMQSVLSGYEYGGMHFTGPIDTILYRLHTIDGCDSVMRFTLIVCNNSDTTLIQDVCDNAFPYYRDNQTFNSAGQRSYAIPNHCGADSNITLVVVSRPTNNKVFFDTICHGGSVVHSDSSFTEEGNYEIRKRSTYGCDSIEVIHLKVWPTFNTVDNRKICAGRTMTWVNGVEYTEMPEQIPNVTLHSAHGCDSTVRLLLQVQEELHDTVRTTVLENDLGAFVYNGAHFSNDVVDTMFRLSSVAGCDSVVHLWLEICRNRDTVVYRNVCDSVFPFTWDGQTFYDEGIRAYSIATHCGGDSNITLHLAKRPSYSMERYDTICDNQSFSMAGKSFNTTGTHNIQLRTVYDCDSVISVMLKVWPSYAYDEEESICHGDTLRWIDGIKYTETMVEAPTMSFNSVKGCDSTVSLLLIVNEPSNTSVHKAVLENDLSEFRYNGVSFSAEVDDTVFVLTDVNGCDSLVHFSLRIYQNSVAEVDESVCDNEFPYMRDGHVFDSAGSYVYVITTQHGADSVITLNLQALPSDRHDTYDTVCPDSTYTWNGTQYYNAGPYSVSGENVYGCDSIERLFLSYWNSYDTLDHKVICIGDTLLWINGQKYAQMEYPAPMMHFISKNGCDSIVRLDLSVSNSSERSQRHFECDSYTWFGETYTNDTIVVHTDTASTSRCGGIVRLILTIGHSNSGIDEQNQCDRYYWHGNTYYESTNAPTYTMRNADGCDSLVTLNLTIRKSTSGVDSVDTCDSYIWPHNNVLYEWNNSNYTQSYARQRPVSRIRNVQGCDSTVMLNLTLRHSTSMVEEYKECYSFTWRGVEYTTSNYSATFDTVNAAGCDSVIRLNLTIFDSADRPVRQEACDSFMWLGTTYYESGTDTRRGLTNEYGCRYSSTLTLNIKYSSSGVDEREACNSFLWHGRRFSTSDSTSTYRSVNIVGCDSVTTLRLRMHYSSQSIYYDTICYKDTLYRSGELLTTPGAHDIVLRDVHGCDSVEIVYLKVWPIFANKDIKSICIGDTLHWDLNGEDYHMLPSPIPMVSYRSVHGCDSVVALDLTVHDTAFGFKRVYVAENDLPAFRYNGASFAGNVEDTMFMLTSAAGCDSVLHFSLTVCPNRDTVIYRSVCDNAYPYVIDGQSFRVNGSHVYTISTYCGADSNITLFLTEKPTYDTVYYDTICEGETFQRSGRSFAFDGTYDIYLRSVFDCDSVEEEHLKVWPIYDRSDIHSICRGDTLLWSENGQSYTDIITPVPKVTRMSKHGCDSTVRLMLTINEPSNIDVNAVVLENDLPHYYNDVVFDTDVTDTIFLFSNTRGCDSVVHYSLHVAWNRDTTIHLSICSGRAATIDINGTSKKIKNEGTVQFVIHTHEGADSVINVVGTNYEDQRVTVRDTICDVIQSGLGNNELIRQRREMRQTMHGCDSIINILTTVRPIDIKYVEEMVKENDLPHTFMDATFVHEVEDSVFQRTNMWDCDSLIHYSLTICPNRDTILYDTVCDDMLPHTWNGKSFFETDTKRTLIQTHCGADSNLTMHLKVEYRTSAGDTINACDSSYWNGTWYRTSNYTDVVHNTNSVGCDSITMLHLSMHYSYRNTYYATICDNERPEWLDEPEPTDGLHTVNLATVDGCDSIEERWLKVWPTYIHTDSQSICRGDTLWWQDGVGYIDTMSLVPMVRYESKKRCDSMVVLGLNVLELSYTWDSDTITENDLPSFRYNGASFMTDVADTLFIFTNSVGCDSLVHYALYVCMNRDTSLYTEICDNEYPHYWNGQRFDAAGRQVYRTLTFCGADSTIVLNLSELPTYRIEYKDTICANENFTRSGVVFSTEGEHLITLSTIHGCDSVENIWLKVWPTFSLADPQSICRGDTLWWMDGMAYTDAVSPVHSNEINDMDSPSVLLTSEHGCDSMISLVLDVRELSYKWVHDTVVENDLNLFRYNNAAFSSDVDDTVFLLKNTVECDSVVHYALFVCRNVFSSESKDLCDNEFPTVWDEVVFEDAGMQSLVKRNWCGADSLISLQINAKLSYRNIHNDTICDDNVKYFEHDYYNVTGVYDHRYRTINGCDSVERLCLVVYPSYNDTDSVWLCRGAGIIWSDGKYYSHYLFQPPVAYLISTHGCDSVRTLILEETKMSNADMYVSPEHPSWEAPEVVISDRSLNTVGRRWYLDGVPLDTSAVVKYTFKESDVDVVVSMVAYDEKGCVDTIRRTIHFNRAGIHVPNIFTPNRIDNNVVRIQGEDILEMECYIYDRRGRQVFKFESMDDFWDGTCKGTPCQQGAYTYVVRYNTIHDPKSWLKKVGTIVLLR